MFTSIELKHRAVAIEQNYAGGKYSTPASLRRALNRIERLRKLAHRRALDDIFEECRRTKDDDQPAVIV